MALFIPCSHCHKELRIPEHAVGKSLRCPTCGSAFVPVPLSLDLPTVDPPAYEAPIPVLLEEEPARPAVLPSAPATDAYAATPVPVALVPTVPPPVPAGIPQPRPPVVTRTPNRPPWSPSVGRITE